MNFAIFEKVVDIFSMSDNDIKNEKFVNFTTYLKNMWFHD